jgi:glycosyltransferase involved in cell wall biosynthesis
MLEAMATELPVVVTQVGGAADVITHGFNGWLIPPDTPAALRDALLTLLGDDEQRVLMGRRGCERVEGNYSLTLMTKRLHDMYQHVVAQQRGTPAAHLATVDTQPGQQRKQ